MVPIPLGNAGTGCIAPDGAPTKNLSVSCSCECALVHVCILKVLTILRTKARVLNKKGTWTTSALTQPYTCQPAVASGLGPQMIFSMCYRKPDRMMAFMSVHACDADLCLQHVGMSLGDSPSRQRCIQKHGTGGKCKITRSSQPRGLVGH